MGGFPRAHCRKAVLSRFTRPHRGFRRRPSPSARGKQGGGRVVRVLPDPVRTGADLVYSLCTTGPTVVVIGNRQKRIVPVAIRRSSTAVSAALSTIRIATPFPGSALTQYASPFTERGVPSAAPAPEVGERAVFSSDSIGGGGVGIAGHSPPASSGSRLRFEPPGPPGRPGASHGQGALRTLVGPS